MYSDTQNCNKIKLTLTRYLLSHSVSLIRNGVPTSLSIPHTCNDCGNEAKIYAMVSSSARA